MTDAHAECYQALRTLVQQMETPRTRKATDAWSRAMVVIAAQEKAHVESLNPAFKSRALA